MLSPGHWQSCRRPKPPIPGDPGPEAIGPQALGEFGRRPSNLRSPWAASALGSHL